MLAFNLNELIVKYKSSYPFLINNKIYNNDNNAYCH